MVCWFVGRVESKRAQVGQGEFGWHWRGRMNIGVTCPGSSEKGEAIESVPFLDGLLVSPNLSQLLNPFFSWTTLAIKHLPKNCRGMGDLLFWTFPGPRAWAVKWHNMIAGPSS